jgi:hypothetical protein
LNALGIDHFLTKPYHPDDLIAHILQEIGSRPIETPSGIIPLHST